MEEFEKELLENMIHWFIREVEVLPRIAQEYTNLLFANNIVTVKRLKQAMQQNKNILNDLKFAQMDIDNIISHISLDYNKSKLSSNEIPLRKITTSLPSQTAKKDAINCILELSDGRIISGSNDGLLKIWVNISTYIVMEKSIVAHSDYIRAFIALKDGRVGSASDDKTIKIWNLNREECELTLIGHTNLVISLIKLSDDCLCSTSADDTIKIWDITYSSSGGQCVRTLVGHKSRVKAVCEIKSGYICSAAADHTIKIWNIASNLCERTLEGHSDAVVTLLLLTATNATKLCSGSADTSMKVWNLSTGKCELTLSHMSTVNAILEIPHPTQKEGSLICCASGKNIKIWDIVTNNCIYTLRGHRDEVNTVIKLKDGRLCSGSDDGCLILWNLTNNEFECGNSSDCDISLWLVLRGRNNNIRISASYDGMIKYWDFNTKYCYSFKNQPLLKKPIICTLELTDMRIAVATENMIYIWNYHNGSCEQQISVVYDISHMILTYEGKICVCFSNTTSTLLLG